MWSRFKKTNLTTKTGAVLGVAVVVYALTAFSTHVYVRAFLMPKIYGEAADLERLETRIIADFKVLSDKPIFRPLPRDKNAEHFLSGFISWSGADVKPLRNLEHDRLVDLMENHDQAAANVESWQRLLDDDALQTLDLAWVDQLIAYDHIDFGTHLAYSERLGKVGRANGIERGNIAANLPLPDLRELRFAAVARVAQLQNEKHISEAPALFRHLGYLFESTDSLRGSLMAVSMLQTEKNLAQRTKAIWPLVDDVALQAFQRAVWAWVGIERLRASKNDLGVFEPYLDRSTGACSGSFETIGFSGQLQDYLTPTALLESDLSERLASADQFQRRLLNLCGHDELKVFLAPIGSKSNPLIVGRYHLNVARIPFLRRIVGLGLIAAVVPKYFDLYDASPREPASK